MLGIAGSLAAAFTLMLVWLWQDMLPHHFPSSDTPPDRLAFAATWLLLPGLALLIGVIGAARRGFYADAIDGTRTPASPALEINLRYNTNTLEQVVLAAIAWAGLALQLPLSMLFLIPVLSVLFFLGRVLFFIGYLIHPMARAYGMVLTVVPTLIGYGWLAWRLVGA